MSTTSMTFAFGEDTWTEVDITFHRTGPAFIITNITEENGWPIVPDCEWGSLEDAAELHVGEIVEELWAEHCESEDPAADWLAQVRRDEALMRDWDDR